MTSWHETNPGTWERETSGYEQFFFFGALASRKLGIREDYIIYTTIKVTPPISPQRLRERWIEMRWLEPNIAITWNEQGLMKVYKVEEDPTEWANETFVEMKEYDNSDEAFPTLPIISKSHLLVFPNGEIALRAPHWIIDARGCMLFWDLFMKGINNDSPIQPINWGEEVSRLPPGTLELLPRDISEQQKKLAQEITMNYVNNHNSPLHPVAIPNGKPTGIPNYSKLTLTVEETDKVIKGSKKNGYSVTSAVHAALVLAGIKYSEPGMEVNSHHGAAVYDIRPLLDRRDVANLVSVPYPFALPLSSPMRSTKFDDVAQWFGKLYRNTFRDDQKEDRLVGEWIETLVKLFTSPEAANAPIKKDPYTSAFGIVENFLDHEYGDYKVDDFHLISETTLGESCLFWFTWKGQLTLTYAYCEGVFERKAIDDMIETIREILLDEYK